MVDGVVMCEKDYAELVATWPCLGCGKEKGRSDTIAIIKHEGDCKKFQGLVL